MKKLLTVLALAIVLASCTKSVDIMPTVVTEVPFKTIVTSTGNRLVTLTASATQNGNFAYGAVSVSEACDSTISVVLKVTDNLGGTMPVYVDIAPHTLQTSFGTGIKERSLLNGISIVGFSVAK